jgi:hypothetical protein
MGERTQSTPTSSIAAFSTQRASVCSANRAALDMESIVTACAIGTVKRTHSVSLSELAAIQRQRHAIMAFMPMLATSIAAGAAGTG